MARQLSGVFDSTQDMHILTVPRPRNRQATMGGILRPVHTVSHTYWIVIHKAAYNSHTMEVA